MQMSNCRNVVDTHIDPQPVNRLETCTTHNIFGHSVTLCSERVNIHVLLGVAIRTTTDEEWIEPGLGSNEIIYDVVDFNPYSNQVPELENWFMCRCNRNQMQPVAIESELRCNCIIFALRQERICGGRYSIDAN